VLDVIERAAPTSIVCLTGISSGTRAVSVDVDRITRAMMLENRTVFGSASANRRHYEAGAASLAFSERDWLARMITKRVPVRHRQDAFRRGPEDLETVIDSTA
jgi:hypothetical protein